MALEQHLVEPEWAHHGNAGALRWQEELVSGQQQAGECLSTAKRQWHCCWQRIEQREALGMDGDGRRWCDPTWRGAVADRGAFLLTSHVMPQP